MNLVNTLMTALKENASTRTLQGIVDGNSTGFGCVSTHNGIEELDYEWRFKIGRRYVLITYSDETTASTCKISIATWEAIKSRAERILKNRKVIEKRAEAERLERIRKEQFYRDLCEAVNEHREEVLDAYETCRRVSKRRHYQESVATRSSKVNH